MANIPSGQTLLQERPALIFEQENEQNRQAQKHREPLKRNI